LSKRNRYDACFVYSFSLFINSIELGNGFSELNDPVKQLRLFEGQMLQRERSDEEAMVLPQSRAYCLPPTACKGSGIDRVVILSPNQSAMHDVTPIPHLRHAEKQQ